MCDNVPLATFILANKQGLRFVVSPESKILGRGSSADFVVNSKSISRLHAKVSLDLDSRLSPVKIEDLGSLNGSFIGEERIVIGYATAGDMVRFGKMEFTVACLDANDDESTLSVRGDLLIPDSNGLSPAQFRVFIALLDGFSEKEVATKLDVSRHTVHNHVREIYARFNVTSRAELMAKQFIRKDLGETGFL